MVASGFLQATPVTSCGHYSGLPPDTRPSNSFPQLAVIWASRLATLQPDATAASQQVPNIRAHTLLPLDHTNTTQITSFFFFLFFKYVKQRCESSSKLRPPLPSADRPHLRLRGRTLSVDADMQTMNIQISSKFHDVYGT